MSLALELSGDPRRDATEIATKAASGDDLHSTLVGAGIILALLHLADAIRGEAEGAGR